MTTAQQLMTAEEFEDKFNGAGPGKSELWYGEVKTMAPPGYEHGRNASRIDRLLGYFADARKLGDVLTDAGFVLSRDPSVVYAPDIAFVELARVPSRTAGYFDGPPSLAVEVVSPNDTFTEVTRKAATYLEYGPPRVWVVDPGPKTITVYRPDRDPHTYGAGDTLSSDDAGFGVEGFSLALAELFSE